MSLTQDRQGIWHIGVDHDDTCVQLRWRRKHGATTSLVIAAEPGRTIPPDLIAKTAAALAATGGPDIIRISGAGGEATSWQEREALDQILEQRGEAS